MTYAGGGVAVPEDPNVPQVRCPHCGKNDPGRTCETCGEHICKGTCECDLS